MSQRFKNKIVVVTGAGGGLGRALSLGYAKEGGQLVLTDVDEKLMAETAKLVEAEGARASTYKLDLGDENAIKAFGAELCKTHPRIDVLFNNAGIAYGAINAPLETHGLDAWLKYLTINSVAPLLLATALRPALAAAKGVILNQSSMASYVPANPYGITKATLNAITFGMAYTFGADGIRVNAIAPGIMETPAGKSGVPAETYARIQGMQLLKLHGLPDDIVNLALFLASDDARFITAQVVPCDAGNQMRGFRF
jgi:3-oxoacyl-[acyl-carrier protein] reductase